MVEISDTFAWTDSVTMLLAENQWNVANRVVKILEQNPADCAPSEFKKHPLYGGVDLIGYVILIWFDTTLEA